MAQARRVGNPEGVVDSRPRAAKDCVTRGRLHSRFRVLAAARRRRRWRFAGDPAAYRLITALYLSLAPAPDFIDAAQQIRRIVVDAERAGLSQLIRPLPAAQKPDAQRRASYLPHRRP